MNLSDNRERKSFLIKKITALIKECDIDEKLIK